MKVSDLQHHELYTAQADECLEVAADRMNWHQVGALPVLEGQHLVGIITERDLRPPWPGADPVHPGVGLQDPAPEVPGPTASSPTRPAHAGAGSPPPAHHAGRPPGRCAVHARRPERRPHRAERVPGRSRPQEVPWLLPPWGRLGR